MGSFGSRYPIRMDQNEKDHNKSSASLDALESFGRWLNNTIGVPES